MKMDSSQVINAIIIILMVFETRECLRKLYGRRQYWVRPLLENRDTHGFFATTFGFPEEFKQTIRMEKKTFDFLLTFVKERLTKHSNRPSISPECRLFMTLAYLAHGGSKQLCSAAFKMGVSTMKAIVAETCEVLWEILGPIYLSIPKESEWKRIASDFYTMWDLPNCVGAIDGKHVNLTCPSNSGSQFYNYKGNYSIVLLAACDANYTFTSVDIGAYGSQSDGGVMWNSSFGQQLYKGQLDLPKEEVLPGTNKAFPHYFVGDAAFPLKPFLMRPYPGSNLPPERELFNKRLSRARRVIENAFGILASRWRILLSTLQMSPASAEKVIKATVVLHNFLKMHDGSYCPPEYADRDDGTTVINGLWRSEVSAPLQRARRTASNNAAKSAFKLRDELMSYVVSNPIRQYTPQ